MTSNLDEYDDTMDSITERMNLARQTMGLQERVESQKQKIIEVAKKYKQPFLEEIEKCPENVKQYIHLLEQLNRRIFCQRCRTSGFEFLNECDDLMTVFINAGTYVPTSQNQQLQNTQNTQTQQLQTTQMQQMQQMQHTQSTQQPDYSFLIRKINELNSRITKLEEQIGEKNKPINEDDAIELLRKKYELL
jgi:hypothetical protein